MVVQRQHIESAFGIALQHQGPEKKPQVHDRTGGLQRQRPSQAKLLKKIFPRIQQQAAQKEMSVAWPQSLQRKEAERDVLSAQTVKPPVETRQRNDIHEPKSRRAGSRNQKQSSSGTGKYCRPVLQRVWFSAATEEDRKIDDMYTDMLMSETGAQVESLAERAEEAWKALAGAEKGSISILSGEKTQWNLKTGQITINKKASEAEKRSGLIMELSNAANTLKHAEWRKKIRDTGSVEWVEGAEKTEYQAFREARQIMNRMDPGLQGLFQGVDLELWKEAKTEEQYMAIMKKSHIVQHAKRYCQTMIRKVNKGRVAKAEFNERLNLLTEYIYNLWVSADSQPGELHDFVMDYVPDLYQPGQPLEDFSPFKQSK
jgi:hypothetical protein